MSVAILNLNKNPDTQNERSKDRPASNNTYH